MEASEVSARELVAFLRIWVENHRHEGGERWHVDRCVVDVDADVLWQVVDHGIRLWQERVARGTSALAPDTSVARDTCACGHHRSEHGRGTVDTVNCCHRCGCWGFTRPVTELNVPAAPVAPEGMPRHD